MSPPLPPLLPEAWSSAYVSYWQPMLPEDQLTSGFCWFDYRHNRCRIDGLFNPWSEHDTGYRLWMSEIGDANACRTVKHKVAYSRETTATGTVLRGAPLADEPSPFHELYLPRAVLRDNHADDLGHCEVLGQSARVWRFERPGKGAVTLLLDSASGLPLRMVSGESCHVSVRDFTNPAMIPIPEAVFAPCISHARAARDISDKETAD